MRLEIGDKVVLTRKAKNIFAGLYKALEHKLDNTFEVISIAILDSNIIIYIDDKELSQRYFFYETDFEYPSDSTKIII